MGSNPAWCVKEASLHDDYTIGLVFEDGSRRKFNMTPLLDQHPWQSLKNPVLFMRGHVECGTVVWSDEVDIAPEVLYEQSSLLEA